MWYRLQFSQGKLWMKKSGEKDLKSHKGQWRPMKAKGISLFKVIFGAMIFNRMTHNITTLGLVTLDKKTLGIPTLWLNWDTVMLSDIRLYVTKVSVVLMSVVAPYFAISCSRYVDQCLLTKCQLSKCWFTIVSRPNVCRQMLVGQMLVSQMWFYQMLYDKVPTY